jgi:hypothetical protein
VSPGSFELQDENFKTLPSSTKVLEAMERGGIIRLAKKGLFFLPLYFLIHTLSLGFNFTPFPNVGGQENVFSPGGGGGGGGGSPFQQPLGGNIFGQRNLFEK